MNFQQTLGGIELQTWLEMFVGLLFEGLLLGLLFYLISKRSEQAMKRHIQEHLTMTDNEIKEVKDQLNTLQVMINQKK